MSAPQFQRTSCWANLNFGKVTVKCSKCSQEFQTINPRDSKYCPGCKRKLAAANSAKQYAKKKAKKGAAENA